MTRGVGRVKELDQKAARLECLFGHGFDPFVHPNCSRIVSHGPEYTMTKLVNVAADKDGINCPIATLAGGHGAIRAGGNRPIRDRETQSPV